MFNQIENLYNEKSIRNKIKKIIVVTYIIIMIILWFFYISSMYVAMFITMFITLILILFIIKCIYERELNVKLHFGIDDKGKKINEMVDDKEKQLFKDYLQKNKIYNKESLECIVSYYSNRTCIKQDIYKGNFLGIISIVISVVLAFVTKDGFDISNFEKSLPYLISFIFMTLIIYYPIKNFLEIIGNLKGKYSIYENLETIFRELYIEYNTDDLKENKNKKSSKEGDRSIKQIKIFMRRLSNNKSIIRKKAKNY